MLDSRDESLTGFAQQSPSDLSFSEPATVFSGAKMARAFLNHFTHRCLILEFGNDSLRFKASSGDPARKKRRGETRP